MRRVLVMASLFSASAALMAGPLQGMTPPMVQAGATQYADASGVDTIVELVKGGMTDNLVLKTIQRDGKPYKLGTADLLKLQKAGVSEKVIEAMMDPSSISPAPAGPAAAVAAQPAPAAPAAPAAPSRGAQKAVVAPPAAGAGAKAAAKDDDKQPAAEKKGGMFSSLKDKLKGSAQKGVDGVGDTTESAVDKGVKTGQAEVDDAIPSVAKPTDKTAAAGTAATTTTTAAAGKATTTAAAGKAAGTKAPAAAAAATKK